MVHRVLSQHSPPKEETVPLQRAEKPFTSAKQLENPSFAWLWNTQCGAAESVMLWVIGVTLPLSVLEFLSRPTFTGSERLDPNVGTGQPILAT